VKADKADKADKVVKADKADKTDKVGRCGVGQASWCERADASELVQAGVS